MNLNIEKPLTILEQIQKETSINKKVEIIKEWHKLDKNTCEKILKFLYDKNIKTNLGSKKIRKFKKNQEIRTMSNLTNDILLDVIYYLSKESTGKDEDIRFARYYVEDTYYGTSEEFMEEFLSKELSLGIDLKLVNKAIPNLIEVIEPMLATNYNNVCDKLDNNLEYHITIKLDGNRLLIDTRETPYKAYSRNGLLVDGLDDFLSNLKLTKGFIYDGELLPSNIEGKNSSEQYKEISSIMRTKGEKDKEKITYYIFDVMLNNTTYVDRRKLFLNDLPNTKYQKVVPILYVGKINKNVFDLLDEVVSDGNEGLMANVSNGKYESGIRSKNIVKFKKFHDVDIKCIDLEKGSGKYKNTLGAIIVDYKGNRVKVGSGFTDEIRDELWNNKDLILNKIVKVKYFEESKDKNGIISLRFPVFIEIRNDKNDVSYE